MRNATASLALIGILLLPLLADAPRAELRQVYLDGRFDDWAGAPADWIDPAGDGGASGIDVQQIWVANDEDYLYVRIEVGGDIVLHDANLFTLYIDTDTDVSTGYSLGIMGADLVWEFGTRSGFFFYGDEWTNIEWDDIGVIQSPTHSATEYELCIARDIYPDNHHPLFPQDEIAMLWRDAQGGDWAPDMGETMPYTFEDGTLPPWEVIDLVREAGPLRLMTHNVYQDQLFVSWRRPAHERLLAAIEPDVIAYQEIYSHSATETRIVVEGALGGSWSADKVGDMVLLTRSEIIDSWSIQDDRAGAFLITPMNEFEHNLLVINMHLHCCDNNADRQAEVDAIMAFVRDARTAGGELDLAPENPIIITGDTNFVGWVRQLETLLTGDISDEVTYGPDFAPDWDDTDLADIISSHVIHPRTYTWYKEWSGYGPGRLDYIITTDSNVEVGTHGVLQTTFLPSSYLNEYGLYVADSQNASDHLPHFADLSPQSQSVDGWTPRDRGALRLDLTGSNPSRDHFRLRFSRPGWLSGAATATVHDAAGRQLRILVPGTEEVFLWDGRDQGGRLASPGAYWIRCRVAGEEATVPVRVVR